jgi:uncharacterized membrane protein YeaQ/YmgE (transglycosylase-associated protein family)
LKILMVAKRRSNLRPSDYRYTTGAKSPTKSLARRRKDMGLITWIVVGAIAGLLAKRLVPGPDPGRFIVTVLLGIGGASVGGFFVGILGGSGATGFNFWSVVVAMLGAIMLLYLYGLIARRAA